MGNGPLVSFNMLAFLLGGGHAKEMAGQSLIGLGAELLASCQIALRSGCADDCFRRVPSSAKKVFMGHSCYPAHA